MIPVCEPFLSGNERKYVLDAIDTAWISSSGKYLSAFENAMAQYCGVKHAIGVCNGTSALHLSLVAFNIQKGDEVILPNFNGIFGAFAVCYTGAKPVFVDVDVETWNIDPSLIEEKITEKTKAIMPVHIYGHPCDMNPIWEIAKKYDLKIIEDAAEAHGAEYFPDVNDCNYSVKAGSLGDISIFSFFANKIITTGEGGMVLTDDDELAEKCRYFKNLCFAKEGFRDYTHNDIGYNYKMTNIMAAIGLAQVEKIDYYIELRRRNHFLYQSYLNEISGINFQPEKEWAKNVFWMNGIVIDSAEYGIRRNELEKILRENKIDCRRFFYPMHRQPGLKKYGCNCEGAYPVADKLSENGLYLPSGSNLDEKSIKYICEIIRQSRKK